MSALVFDLKAHPRWPTCAAPLPIVRATIRRTNSHCSVHFSVQETHATYRAEIRADGGPCWQDSCVEIFTRIPQSDLYLNLEFSATGACLGARGPNRKNRVELSPDEYRSIRRRVSVRAEENTCHWEINIQIPWSLMGVSDASATLYGNLQKCGDLSQAPHWLSAFFIDTPKPDFHRPEYFGLLLPAATHF